MKRDLGVLVNHELNLNERCAAVTKKERKKESQQNARLHWQGHHQLSNYHIQSLSGYTWNTVLIFGPCYTEGTWTVWRGQGKGYKYDPRPGKPVIWLSERTGFAQT